MTPEQAKKLVAQWHALYPEAGLFMSEMVEGELKTFLSYEGEAVRDHFVKYERDQVMRAMAEERTANTFKPKIAGVRARLAKQQSLGKATTIPEQWREMGHGAVFSFGDHMGILELDCADPVAWVLQQRWWGGARLHDEWTTFPPSKYTAGAFTKLAQDQADRLKAAWWVKESITEPVERKFSTSGPWHLYCPKDGPQRSVEECLKILMNWAKPKRLGLGVERLSEALMPGAAKKPVVDDITPGMLEIERQRAAAKTVIPGSHIGWVVPEDDPIGF